MDFDHCMPRKPWELPFMAQPEEVAGLRRIMRMHLQLWGLSALVDAAQLCVTELVTNTITHVGAGTPTTLAVSMNGTHLRIEVHDPCTRELPTLLAVEQDSECGRGITLVDAVADRWGVVLRADSKVTWCELDAEVTAPHGETEPVRFSRAEALLGIYGTAKPPWVNTRTPLSMATAEEAAIEVITDLLHWLRARGCDPDTSLDRAQMRFEAELKAG
ncbi:ATP-binding protein [Streptomyces sp. A3M-1-3]|uniref:ATP-binding protein n=1 Tax=Streptomyces sp. A3M-1-3 TaxID=2962044 RepID=UPI0020B762E0|nr:ATP-binding protein [Streptomyces sp. A3M-1-3]MCP3819495.1 ATP-binding protein [Streptomyces sp. A3M-1-3]